MKFTHLFKLLFALVVLAVIVPTARSVKSSEPFINAQANPARQAETSDQVVIEESVYLQGPLPNNQRLSSSPSTLSSVIARHWQLEFVERSKNFRDLTERSLRLDDAGHLHIAYGYRHLYYAWYDGTEWHYETIDTTENVGGHASLALDGANRPHISYCDGANQDLKYAWHDGTTWHIETVDSGGDVGKYTSLALDGAGRPRISYHGNNNLKYAWHDGTGWHIGIVDSTGDVDQNTSLALDGANRPHISYYDGARDLKYAWHDGTTWHIETVDNTGFKYTSLALDGIEQPHIIYVGSHGHGTALKHAWFDRATWHIEIVSGAELGGGSFSHPSLAFDGANRPHVSYRWYFYNYEYPNDKIKYAWFDGTTWHYETVDNGAVGRYYTSLALDAAEQPHIIYYKGDLVYGLRHTWHDGTTWQVETVDDLLSIGEHNSLALDEASHPHISYCDETRSSSAGFKICNLKYAWHDGTTWHIETVDDRAAYTSLALDGAGRPHISYYSSDTWNHGSLKYAWHDGTTWHIETVHVGGDVGQYTSLALDEAERPHISYYGSDLKYAWHDGTTWQIETVDSEGGVGRYTSLALDEAGHPHISYYDGSNNALKYAWHDGTTWHVETVDSEEYAGRYNSLALDRAGRPHISYSSDCILKYAWRDNTVWHIETVDSSVGTACTYTSLALDEAARPHISFYSRYPDYTLRYAWRDGTTWHVETVDSEKYAGRYTSLALDRAGRPHISYEATTGLKYTQLIPTLLLDKQATPSDSLHNNDTLTYTLTLSGPGLDVRLWDPLPSAVRYVSGSLTTTLTPAATYSATAHAIGWQGLLPTDTVGVVRFQVTPGITGTGSLSLTPPIVNTAWLTDTENDRSISSTVIVNGRRFYLPLATRNE